MKYCPQCNKQYSEAWLTFCTDDGSILREDLTPAADPNSDPRIRETKYDDPSEHETQWLPKDTPAGGGWMAPGESAPVARGPVERPWQPPPPPPLPPASASPPGMAIASLILGILGLMIGLACWVPVPGIIAIILGIIALKQMRLVPNSTGRALAIVGIVLGGVNLAIFALGILWFLLAVTFG